LYQLQQRGLKFGILPEFKDYGTHIGTGSGCIALMNHAPHSNAARPGQAGSIIFPAFSCRS